MPLHLEGVLPKGISDNTLTVLKNGVRSAEPLYASLDETVFHMRKRMKDSLSDDEFGSIIYTVKITEWPLEKLNIIDIDIIEMTIIHNGLTIAIITIGGDKFALTLKSYIVADDISHYATYRTSDVCRMIVVSSYLYS